MGFNELEDVRKNSVLSLEISDESILLNTSLDSHFYLNQATEIEAKDWYQTVSYEDDSGVSETVSVSSSCKLLDIFNVETVSSTASEGGPSFDTDEEKDYDPSLSGVSRANQLKNDDILLSGISHEESLDLNKTFRSKLKPFGSSNDQEKDKATKKTADTFPLTFEKEIPVQRSNSHETLKKKLKPTLIEALTSAQADNRIAYGFKSVLEFLKERHAACIFLAADSDLKIQEYVAKLQQLACPQVPIYRADTWQELEIG